MSHSNKIRKKKEKPQTQNHPKTGSQGRPQPPGAGSWCAGLPCQGSWPAAGHGARRRSGAGQGPGSATDTGDCLCRERALGRRGKAEEGTAAGGRGAAPQPGHPPEGPLTDPALGLQARRRPGAQRQPAGPAGQHSPRPGRAAAPGAPPAGCQRRAAPGQLAPCPAEPPGRGWGEGGGPRAAGPEAPGPSSPPRNTPGHAASTAPTVTSPASRQVPRARQPRPYRGDAAAPGAHWPVACRWRERATGRGHAAAGSGVRWGRRGRE